MRNKVMLKLYINGMTSTAQTALDNLEDVCRDLEEETEFSIEVIDIRKHPQLAEDEKIIATPTVVKTLPPPIRRVIGNLSQRNQLLLGLDLVKL